MPPCNNQKGFLLLELLVATVILATVGIALSQTFSREIELFRISHEYQDATALAVNQLREHQLALFKVTSPEEWQALQTLEGEIPAKPGWKYQVLIEPHEMFEQLQTLTVTITGLKDERQVRLSRLIHIDPNILANPEDEDEDGDPEGEFL